ncbi:hypothetical protein MUP37_07740 [Candidatus Bathyarchaeota archaeon]|nr:hypothetical protein [Candidatus Bathyarchaeota archaeon]
MIELTEEIREKERARSKIRERLRFRNIAGRNKTLHKQPRFPSKAPEVISDEYPVLSLKLKPLRSCKASVEVCNNCLVPDCVRREPKTHCGQPFTPFDRRCVHCRSFGGCVRRFGSGEESKLSAKTQRDIGLFESI